MAGQIAVRMQIERERKMAAVFIYFLFLRSTSSLSLFIQRIHLGPFYWAPGCMTMRIIENNKWRHKHFSSVVVVVLAAAFFYIIATPRPYNWAVEATLYGALFAQ